jgi:hypothetical protein
MPVPISPPLTIASQTRTFDLWFYTDFHARNLTPTTGTLAFTRVPMNAATGDTYPEGAESMEVDFWKAAQEVPEAATAMNQVLAALPLIQAHFTNP